ncbi:MAG: hypothetical protein IJ635_00060 [Bacteroidaceae bacterium]|nr:hypothetical protein [Bacteroidaceae bacterium]
MRTKAFSLVLSMFLVLSCQYSAVYTLNNEDLSWMSPYKKGDTVLFVSSDKVDTMIVDEFILHNSPPSIVPNEGTSIYYANGKIENIFFHQGGHFSSSLYVGKEDKDLVLVNLSLNHRKWRTTYSTSPQMQKVSFAGYEYNDVIIANESNSECSLKSADNCEYFIWSKSQGLIQYKYLDGDTYTFYKKLPYQVKRNN